MKSYIISLSKISSSLESAIEVSDSLKKYGVDSVLFEGTYGNDAEKIFKEQGRNLHYSLKEGNKTSSPGVKGCFYSHYRLWKKCIEMNEPIMIFEDDVIFYRGFYPVDFKNLLIISINYDWKVTAPYRKYLEEESPTISALPSTLKVMPGASGYILKPHAAKILVEEYKTSYLPADLAIHTGLFDIEFHSRLMGRSKTMNEKQSLTRYNGWNKNDS